VNNTLIPI